MKLFGRLPILCLLGLMAVDVFIVHGDVESTCRDFVANSDVATVSFDFCVESLRSDNKSERANSTVLPHVAVGITGRKVLSTKNKMAELAKTAKGRMASCLDDCLHHYFYVQLSIDDSSANMGEAFDDWEDATQHLTAAISYLSDCVVTFEKANVTSPIHQESSDVEKLLRITEYLARKNVP